MIRGLVAALFLVATLFFGQAFFERYWAFRDCFGDEGRCYDPETEQVLVPTAGPLWGTCTLISFAGVVGALTVPGRARKKREQRP